MCSVHCLSVCWSVCAQRCDVIMSDIITSPADCVLFLTSLTAAYAERVL